MTVVFWHPLNLLLHCLMLLSFCSCLTVISVLFMSSHSLSLCIHTCQEPNSQCLFFALLQHFIDFSFFFFFLFYVLCLLTGLCVACLLSCPSLNVARQSAEPWASKSTKVKLTHLPTTHLSSPRDSLPHCSPTLRHDFQFHSPNEGSSEWQRVGLIHQHCSRGF